jgi:hypothetical protein
MKPVEMRTRFSVVTGTSLSKVYGAIRRFSEDVDVTVDYKSHDQSIDPFDPKVSRTAREKFTELLRTKLADHTKNVIRPHFENLVAHLTEKSANAIMISEDGEKLSIPYPSRFGGDESVLLEFGGRNVIAPNQDHPLRPYIAAEVRDLLYPEATVQVLSPSRTFWEKATLIHVACNRSDSQLDADRQSRHWHDLAVLSDHKIGQASMADRKLLERCRKAQERLLSRVLYQLRSLLVGRPPFDSGRGPAGRPPNRLATGIASLQFAFVFAPTRAFD